MGFSLWVFGVNLGVSGHCNAYQLVSPDHHSMHLKGVCLNALIVMSSHGLADFSNPFQSRLSPETAFAKPTGSSYPLPVLLLGGSYGHFICVQASDAVPRSCVHIRFDHILPGQVRVRWGLTTSNPWPACHSTIIMIGSGPGWTGRGLVGSCSCCCFKLVPVPSTNVGMSSLPCAVLCSFLPVTSWESTCVLLSRWLSSEPLEEQSHFLCVETARNSANWCPTGGVSTKEISNKGGTRSGGVPSAWFRLLEGPWAGEPSDLDAAGMSTYCCTAVAIILLL